MTQLWIQGLFPLTITPCFKSVLAGFEPATRRLEVRLSLLKVGMRASNTMLPRASGPG